MIFTMMVAALISAPAHAATIQIKSSQNVVADLNKDGKYENIIIKNKKLYINNKGFLSVKNKYVYLGDLYSRDRYMDIFVLTFRSDYEPLSSMTSYRYNGKNLKKYAYINGRFHDYSTIFQHFAFNGHNKIKVNGNGTVTVRCAIGDNLSIAPRVYVTYKVSKGRYVLDTSRAFKVLKGSKDYCTNEKGYVVKKYPRSYNNPALFKIGYDKKYEVLSIKPGKNICYYKVRYKGKTVTIHGLTPCDF